MYILYIPTFKMRVFSNSFSVKWGLPQSLRFSQWYCWRFKSCGMWRIIIGRVDRDVLRDRNTSVFRNNEWRHMVLQNAANCFAHHRASHLRRLECDVTYVLYKYKGCPVCRTISYSCIYKWKSVWLLIMEFVTESFGVKLLSHFEVYRGHPVFSL